MELGRSEGEGGGRAVEEQQRQPLMEGGVERRRKRPMKVMVAIDESDESFYALSWAIEHLGKSVGMEVQEQPEEEEEEERGMFVLVHVQQPFQHFVYPAFPTGAGFYATSSMLESVKKAQEENAAILLSRALQMCTEKTIKGETLVLTGDPKDLICQLAGEIHVDLLVLGSRGLGKIKRAFLGSVSDYCAHHAKCPILIVKPPKEEATKTVKPPKEQTIK